MSPEELDEFAEEIQRRKAPIRVKAEQPHDPDWSFILGIDSVSETVTFGSFSGDPEYDQIVRWDTLRTKAMAEEMGAVNYRRASDAVREAQRIKRAKVVDPVFGELQHWEPGTATYLSKESRERIAVTIDQAEAIAAALVRAGSVDLYTVLRRVGQAAEEAADGLGELQLAFDKLATPPPPPPTPDQALTIILTAIRKSPDAFKTSGEWLMKITNEISEIAREASDE